MGHPSILLFYIHTASINKARPFINRFKPLSFPPTMKRSINSRQYYFTCSKGFSKYKIVNKVTRLQTKVNILQKPLFLFQNLYRIIILYTCKVVISFSSIDIRITLQNGFLASQESSMNQKEGVLGEKTNFFSSSPMSDSARSASCAKRLRRQQNFWEIR